jgi:hypothetical protein
VAFFTRLARSHTANTLQENCICAMNHGRLRVAVFRQYTMIDMVGDVVSNHESLSGSSRVATPHQFLQCCWIPMDLGAALGASGTSRYEVSLGKAAMAVSIQRRAD